MGVASGDADRDEQDDFKPLTRDEALQWRARQPVDSVWRVVVWQVVLALLAGALIGVWGGWPAAWSAWYGGACVALPTVVMARGVTSGFWSRVASARGNASLAGFVFWEGVKVLLAMAMLWSAPKWVPDLSWLALLAGLVVALKAYWIVWWTRPRSVSSGV